MSGVKEAGETDITRVCTFKLAETMGLNDCFEERLWDDCGTGNTDHCIVWFILDKRIVKNFCEVRFLSL